MFDLSDTRREFRKMKNEGSGVVWECNINIRNEIKQAKENLLTVQNLIVNYGLRYLKR